MNSLPNRLCGSRDRSSLEKALTGLEACEEEEFVRCADLSSVRLIPRFKFIKPVELRREKAKVDSDRETKKAIKEMKKPISLVPIVKPLTGKKPCKGIHKLVCRAKDSERLLIKTKKRKRKENIASDESIGVYKSPSEFEQRPTTQKVGNDDERLLVKAKKRKIKMNRISDESIGACESSEFEKGFKTQKGNDDERLLVKAKKRKIKMNRISDESIGACESSEFEKGSKTQKGKDGERLLVKAKKRKIKENRTSDEACESVSEFEKGQKTQNDQRSAKVDSWQSSIQSETLSEIENFIEPEVAANESKTKTRKFKKDSKHKKKHFTNVKESSIEEVQRLVDEEKVDEISSVDDDCTRGMKKWLTQYEESRPGFKVLQQRIDEFVTAHEERLEQERKEREARAADDGWTVVVHQKGRKKTTDAETGTVVGSVASAAVMDKMSKKKSKEIALDFYRFQKREAKRNEVMMLQSKFEQDKKRIQQLRAARKFRPS